MHDYTFDYNEEKVYKYKVYKRKVDCIFDDHHCLGWGDTLYDAVYGILHHIPWTPGQKITPCMMHTQVQYEIHQHVQTLAGYSTGDKMVMVRMPQSCVFQLVHRHFDRLRNNPEWRVADLEKIGIYHYDPYTGNVR